MSTTPPYNSDQAVLRSFDDILNAFRVTGTTGGSSGGSLLAGLVFDAVDATYPNPTTEVYFFYTGGLSGTLVATVTIVYTDSTKEFIDTAVKT